MDTRLDAGLKAARKALEAGHPDDALAALTPVLHRSRELGARDAEMLCLGLLGPALDQLDRHDEALRAAHKALAIAEALEDAESAGHFEAMVAQLETGSLQGPSDPGEPLTDDEIGAAFDKAELALTQGNAAAAVGILAALATATRQQARTADEASACGMLAQALMMCGREADAAQPAARGLEIARELGDPQAIAHFSALAESLQGPDGAGAEIERARVAAQVAAACEGAGKLLDEEKGEEALATLEAALALTDAVDAPHAEATVRGLLAQSYLLLNRRDEAAAMASRALELAQQVGDRSAADQFRELLKMLQGWKPSPVEA